MRAIIVASFGTTHTDAWERCIRPIEDMARGAYPAYGVLGAYTSSMVRERLKQRGISVFSPEAAIETLSARGISETYILPTHLLCGIEYEKLQAAMTRFPHIRKRLARPLLCGKEDFDAVLNAIEPVLPQSRDEGLVLMGHGSQHPCNALYTQMNDHIREKGMGNIFVATVDAEPGLGEALEHMRALGVKRVTITPLLLVAGDHAKHDMAGGSGSWLCAFRAAGFEAEAVVKGLGEYPGIRNIYAQRLREIL